MIPYTVLASASPRRKELLTQAGFSFCIMPAKNEEDIHQTPPEDIVKELSLQKAEEVATRLSKEEHPFLSSLSSASPFLIIGADTIVSHKGRILGKPKTERDAFQTLSLLQGNTHQVYTSVTLISCQNTETSIVKKKTYTFVEKTDVTVFPMTEQEIFSYIETKDCMDKAGSYGIQGPFAIYIKGIKGDYYNVVGLPISRLYQEIKLMF